MQINKKVELKRKIIALKKNDTLEVKFKEMVKRMKKEGFDLSNVIPHPMFKGNGVF